MAAHRPATTASRLPSSTLRHVTSRSSATPTSAARSDASNSVRSSTLCTSVPTRAPAGMAASPKGTVRRRSSSGASPAVRRTVTAGSSSSDVSCSSGSLPIAGWSWTALRDARVRHAAPSEVERTIEDGRLERRWRTGVPLPSLIGRDADALDRHPGPSAVTAASTASSVGRRRTVRAHHALLVAVEQQTGQRRVLAVTGAHPPQNRLMLGTGERDVEQPQVLAPFLDQLVLLVDGEAVALACDVDGARVPVVLVVEHGNLDRGGVAAPHVGAEHDRELQPLAPVDRDHLDRLGVRFETSRPFLVLGVAFGLVDAPTEPTGHRGRAQAVGHPGLVEQLGDVPQIRHGALTRWTGEDTGRHIVGAADLLVEGGDAPVTQQGGPLVQRPVEVLPIVLAGRRHPFGRPADEAGQRSQRRPVPGRRPLERLEQAQPVPRRLGPEHRAGTADDGRHTRSDQGVPHGQGMAVRAHEHGDVTGMQRGLLARCRRAGA